MRYNIVDIIQRSYKDKKITRSLFKKKSAFKKSSAEIIPPVPTIKNKLQGYVPII